MSLKLLLVVLAVVLLFWLLAKRGRKATRRPRRKADATPRAGLMLQCAHCGVHLPQADAVTDAEGRAFCSAAHRVAGPDDR